MAPIARSLRRLCQLAPLAAAGAALLFLAGCAALPTTEPARAALARLTEVPARDGLSRGDAGILTLDADMRAFLAKSVHGRDGLTKLRELIQAVVESPTFRLEYDDDTHTAAETFRELRGNCLSFTNLFVALAREAGLTVSYQEVDVPPTWTLHDDTFVVSRHINALVTARPGTSHVVDFNIADFRAAYPRRAISDERAAAHYFSNLGIESLEAGSSAAAYEYFQRALAMDATLAQTWVNLGAWYRRNGDAARAEASYLQALRLNPRELVAMSNLASLHRSAGRNDLAAWYQRRITKYRLQNPYYRYASAKVAYLAGDFSGAVHQLRAALRGADGDPTFYSLLGMSYRELGKREPARRAFARAVELARDGDLRGALRHKLEMLGAANAGT